jgi:DNA-binding IclR family transcriptional regulator
MSAAVLPGADQHIVGAIVGEFNEMPGMKLTREQFCRLWGLQRDQADRVIRSLVACGFLRRDQHDRYRRTEGDV